MRLAQLIFPALTYALPRLTVVVLLFTGLLALPAKGQAAEKPLPRIVDPAYRYPKGLQLEVTAFGGTYLSASLKNTWIAGGRALFHFSQSFALGAAYGSSYIDIGAQDGFGSVLTDKSIHFLDAEIMVSNDAAIRFGKSVLEFDLYLTAGVGAMYLNDKWEFLGLLGGGMKFYTPLSWLAIRLDLLMYFHRTGHATRSVVDVDIGLTAGVAILLPPRKRRR